MRSPSLKLKCPTLWHQNAPLRGPKWVRVIAACCGCMNKREEQHCSYVRTAHSKQNVFAAERMLPLACCLLACLGGGGGGGRGVLGLPVASSPWRSPAITGKGGPSLTVRPLVFYFAPCFVGCGLGLFFFFYGSAWEIFYKVLHFAPGLCWTQPEISRTCVVLSQSVTAH